LGHMGWNSSQRSTENEVELNDGTHLRQSPQRRRATLPNLIRHRAPREINPQLLHEARLVRPVDQVLCPAHPQVLDGGKVVDHDGPLVADLALDHVGIQASAPLGEHGGIVLGLTPAEEVHVADEGEGVWELGDVGDFGEVGAEGFALE
jgi:hypothetical protein